MFIEQPPQFFRSLYPQAVWRMDRERREVYLTFDDGPVPEITHWTLDLLDKYGIKATFFMVGDNIRKYPYEYQRVIDRGHAVGNHTFHHLQGIRTPLTKYINNVSLANVYLSSVGTSSKDSTGSANSLNNPDSKVLPLFRPPHGFMLPSQYRYLAQHYRIVMWDVVTRDYSRRVTGEQVFANVRRYVRNGSIITFHDSCKAESKLRYALPRSIEWLIEQGYEFGTF